ncbi:hypothetical protein EON83_10250 [bacterium]|nr:MAG: hypothetical protein EON83_10250 [bacterium]
MATEYLDVSNRTLAPASQSEVPRERAAVTPRSFAVGLVLAAGLAALNSWIETVADVHFLGGIQIPFGAIFALLILVLVVNGPLRFLQRRQPLVGRLFPPLTSAELVTIYVMLLFAALVSTSGSDNFFLTTGAALFYFSTRENVWADLFYRFIPKHFAPGWDGATYQREVIEPLYTGGLNFSQIPWHAWSAMLIGWGIFLLFVYSALFWSSLLLRRQWIENEALAFPLVQLPLQMVEASKGEAPPAREFWGNGTLWGGAGVAFAFHLLRGLNNYYPDWPAITSFQGNSFSVQFTEVPWNSAGGLGMEFFFGAIGIAFLLTREISFSFWFFFLLFKLQLVGSTMMGFPPASLPHDSYRGNPTFVAWQGIGGWVMTGVLLLWSARSHLGIFARQALKPDSKHEMWRSEEPFSPRIVLSGWVFSCVGLLAWCLFSGINGLAAFAFLALYGVTAIVLARVVVEGGFLFPQTTFAPIETLTGSVMGANAIGAASLTRLSFLQPMMFSDMRTNLLPGFLHTLKMAHELKFSMRDVRRLMLGAALAILVAWGVSTLVTLLTLYSAGGLTGYSWFTQSGPQSVLNGTRRVLTQQPGVEASNWMWLATGAAIVWALTFMRARFLWFPLHPLAFLMAGGFPITKLWASFFIGWATKSLVLRFGGNDTAQRVRPFMLGLILGNAAAMMLWMLVGFFMGSQIPYWPA